MKQKNIKTIKSALTNIFRKTMNYSGKTTLINKVFGNLTYNKTMSTYKGEYQIRSFEETIELTENELGEHYDEKQV